MFGNAFMSIFLQMFSEWSNFNKIPVCVKAEGNMIKVVCMKDSEEAVNIFFTNKYIPRIKI